ncbi:MAG TPA: YceI family protein [Gemmatimonadales bacterium]|nr:YceI family protein [Gemmatimonadales bacterium]
MPGAGIAQVVERASSRPPAAGAAWLIDPTRSSMQFRVQHLISQVQGAFTRWSGTITTEDHDWTRGTVNVVAEAGSIATGNTMRDADLRSAAFFAADSFPQLTFESTGLLATDSIVEMGGILTMKGRARHVVFTGRWRGIERDQNGHEWLSFDAGTTISRRAFDIGWTDQIGARPVIGDSVAISIAVMAIRVR